MSTFDLKTSSEPELPVLRKPHRRLLFQTAFLLISPLCAILYFQSQTGRLREYEQDSILLAHFPFLATAGTITPKYHSADLHWKAAVPNQMTWDNDHNLHVITDFSTFSYQIMASFPVDRSPLCFVRFAIEVIKGGAYVMILDQQGNALATKSYDQPGHHEDDLGVGTGENRSLTVLVGNNVPGKGQSDFRVLRFDVYMPPIESLAEIR